jgi:hypothetical protein
MIAMGAPLAFKAAFGGWLGHAAMAWQRAELRDGSLRLP